MLKILNKILANQLDPETVMGKLDEIFNSSSQGLTQSKSRS